MKWIGLLAIGFLLIGCGAKKPPKPTHAELIAAITKNQPELVEQMIKDGADVNEADPDGTTPLHLTARTRMLGMAQILVKHGAKVNARRSDGSTPLNDSISDGRGLFAKFLLENGADPTLYGKDSWLPIHWTIGAGQEEVLELILKNGGSANTDDGGNPILYTAAANGTLKSMKILLDHGAKPNAKQKAAGLTPIFAAALQGKGGVDMLLKHGADINAKNWAGETVLDYVIRLSNTPGWKSMPNHLGEMIVFLKEHGAKTGKHRN